MTLLPSFAILPSMPRKKEYARLGPGEMSLFVHCWSRALHKRLKSAAARKGLTMRSAFTEAVEKWLKENKG